MRSVEPLVSVVVTCFNHQDYIEDCVHSVLSQTYSNIELVAVNDGSSDRSGIILDDLAQKHGFTVLHQKNAGVSAAMEKGISICKGQYIATLDSDDLFFPDKISKQVAFMQDNPEIAICGGGMLLIDEVGTISAPRRFPPRRELDFEDVLFEQKDIIPSSSALIRRDVFDAVGGYSANYRIQDLYFWLKVTAAGYKIAALHDVLIYYRKHAKNSHTNYKKVFFDTLKIYNSYSHVDGFRYAVNRFMVSMFLKTSNQDKAFSLYILKKIPLSCFNMKILRGIIRVLNPISVKKNVNAR